MLRPKTRPAPPARGLPRAINEPSPAPALRSKRSRTERRQQIIDATIEVLALRGYARITLTEIAKQAGLSQALVNFHFETKDQLLANTLEYLAEEYLANWSGSLERAAPDPASQLDAMVRADFHPALCTPSRLSAWCAFWGETQSRPLFQQICGAKNEHYNHTLEAICRALMSEGGYSGHAVRIARSIRTVIEGIWFDLITLSAPYDHREAVATVYCSVSAFFPRHFDTQGLIGGKKSKVRKESRPARQTA
jgi:TetR/AcrR family transcriptional repressor of bet genes